MSLKKSSKDKTGSRAAKGHGRKDGSEVTHITIAVNKARRGEESGAHAKNLDSKHFLRLVNP